jgi:hypothetical protein
MKNKAPITVGTVIDFPTDEAAKRTAAIEDELAELLSINTCTLAKAHHGPMSYLTEAQIRRRLRQLGYVTRRSPDGFHSGFRVIDAMSGNIIAGEDFNLSVDDLAELLRYGDEATTRQKR